MKKRKESQFLILKCEKSGHVSSIEDGINVIAMRLNQTQQKQNWHPRRGIMSSLTPPPHAFCVYLFVLVRLVLVSFLKNEAGKVSPRENVIQFPIDNTIYDAWWLIMNYLSFLIIKPAFQTFLFRTISQIILMNPLLAVNYKNITR